MVVVIHHCLLTQPAFSDFFFSTWQTPPHNFFETLMFHTPLRLSWDGYEAVTLFYVLSGLVLALPWVEGRPPSYIGYCIKRIGRIYLPYCVAIALAAALNVALQPRLPLAWASEWLNEMTWSNPVTPWSLADHALMIGHYNTINGVIHSLIWEMRVSLLFPLIIAPLVCWRMRGALAVAIGLAVVIGGIQLLYAPAGATWPLERQASLGVAAKVALEVQWTAYYSIFFVVGAMISMHIRQVHVWLVRVRWGGILSMVLGLLIIQEHWTTVHPVQEMMVAAGSALVIIGALAPGRIARVLSHPLPRFLGAISYSLYLVHVPLLLAALLLLQGIVPPLVILFAVPPVAVLLGWAFHHAVAQPCVRLGQQIAARFAARPVAPKLTWEGVRNG